MVLRGRALGFGSAAAKIAALLDERDLLGPRSGADLHERLRVLHGEYHPPRLDHTRLRHIRHVAQRLMPTESGKRTLPTATDTWHLLSHAYPYRIAQQCATHS